MKRRQGRPSRYTPVPGHAFLTADEVQQLQQHGGSKALKGAFQWLYNSTTKSSNLVWLRAMLRGTGADDDDEDDE